MRSTFPFSQSCMTCVEKKVYIIFLFFASKFTEKIRIFMYTMYTIVDIHVHTFGKCRFASAFTYSHEQAY